MTGAAPNPIDEAKRALVVAVSVHRTPDPTTAQKIEDIGLSRFGKDEFEEALMLYFDIPGNNIAMQSLVLAWFAFAHCPSDSESATCDKIRDVGREKYGQEEWDDAVFKHTSG